jgi:hypothetical protein
MANDSIQRRKFIRWSSLLSLTSILPSGNLWAAGERELFKSNDHFEGSDRAYWVALLEKIAAPVLDNMSRGMLRKNMVMEVSPAWDNRDKTVGYMEAIGRLLAGMAPWFALPYEDTKEGRLRKRLHDQALQSLANGVNPESPDLLNWGNVHLAQPLVDAAFIAQAFLAAPQALWEPLDTVTKTRFIHAFKSLRQIKPGNNNWVLFAAIIESFLLSLGEEFDAERIDTAIDKILHWYVGDGWYSDGPVFAMDHYNGYVIQPMLVEVLKVNVAKGRHKQEVFDLTYKRMQRYASFLERCISPEGTYLVVGRSSTYRAGTFQPLVKLALDNHLPEEIEPAQVRCALTAVLKNLFIPATFTKEGWLQLGLVGDRQQDLADSYSNTGSMYLTSFVFMALGLPGTHEFWSKPFAEWTQRKAWSGKPFNRDHAVKY